MVKEIFGPKDETEGTQCDIMNVHRKLNTCHKPERTVTQPIDKG